MQLVRGLEPRCVDTLVRHAVIAREEERREAVRRLVAARDEVLIVVDEEEARCEVWDAGDSQLGGLTVAHLLKNGNSNVGRSAGCSQNWKCVCNLGCVAGF